MLSYRFLNRSDKLKGYPYDLENRTDYNITFGDVLARIEAEKYQKNILNN